MSLFFTRPVEVRASGSWPTQLIPSRSVSGRLVDANTSSQVVAFGSTVNTLASIVSMLPLDEFTGTGKQQRQVPLDRLFTDPEGMRYGLQDWLYKFVDSAGYRGNTVGVIRDRDGAGVPTRIELADLDSVAVRRELDGVAWQVDSVNIPRGQIMHYRRFPAAGSSILGRSPIRQYANTLGLALASEQFGAAWFADGATPSAILTSDQAISQDDARTIKDRFIAAVRGSREPAVLGAGLTYTQVQVSPEESQFLATQEWSAAQVARILGPGFAEIMGYATGDSMTYRNREQVAIDLLTYTVDPWLTSIEQALSNLLARPRYVRFNRAALLRTDTKTRFEAHAIALAGAAFKTQNEVRSLEDCPALPGYDALPTTVQTTNPSGNGTPAPPGGTTP